MKGIQSIWRLTPEERLPVALLFVYSFVQGVAFAYFYTAATATFLVNFSRTMLPASYIVSGVVVYGLSLLYNKLQPKFSLSKGYASMLFFVLASVGLQLAAFALTGNKWITFAFFVWIRVLVYVNGVIFWGVANKLFNLRQGKRLFGLISAGEVIAFIISFFSTPLLVKVLDTEDLFYFTLAALVLCQLLLLYITARFKTQLGQKPVAKAAAQQGDADEELGFGKSRYFRLIFVLAFVPIFGTLYVDFLFFAQSKVVYPEKDVLSSFLGIFFGISSIIEFAVKAFLSGAVLSRYGLSLGLLLLPAAMVGSFFLATFGGWLYGAEALFFSFLTLSRLFMRTFRTGINDPAFQVLFQPIPAEHRSAFQSKVEGGPKAFGNILAGVVIMAISAFSFFNLVHFSFLFLVIAALWSRLAILMYKEYRLTLNALIAGSGQQGAVEGAGYAQGEMARQVYDAPTLQEAKAYYTAYRRLAPAEAEQWLLQELAQAPTEQRKLQAGHLAAGTLLRKAYPLLPAPGDSPDWQYICQVLEKAKAIPFEKLAGLIDTPNFVRRMRMARLLGQSGRFKASSLLGRLLQDPHPAVKQAAQRAVIRYKRPEIIIMLAEHLSNPAHAYGARDTLACMGDDALPALARLLARNESLPATLYMAVQAVARIGGKEAVRVLQRQMGSSNRLLQRYIMQALQRLNYKANAAEEPVVRLAIEAEIGIVVWLMACIEDLRADVRTAPISEALEASLAQSRENIFLFLSILYDTHVIDQIREGMEGGSPQGRSFALEIMDLTLSERLKLLVLPLLDSPTYADTLERYREQYPQIQTGIEERLLEVIWKEFSYVDRRTKAMTIEVAMSVLGLSWEKFILPNLQHADPLIADTALFMLRQLHPDVFNTLPERFLTGPAGQQYPQMVEQDHHYLPLGEIIYRLRDSKPFPEDWPMALFVALAVGAERIYLKPGDRHTVPGGYETIAIVLEGNVRLERQLGQAGPGDLIEAGGVDSLSWTADDHAFLLAWPTNALLQIFDEHLGEHVIAQVFTEHITPAIGLKSSELWIPEY